MARLSITLPTVVFQLTPFVLLQRTQLMQVWYQPDRMDHTKALPAQNTCQSPFCLPVSKLAVLPIRKKAPAIPKIVPSWGLYLLMLKVLLYPTVMTQQYTMKWLRAMRTAPEMVPSLKTTNQGQWSAVALIQVSGKGFSWWKYCEMKQHARMEPTPSAQATMGMKPALTSPRNIVGRIFKSPKQYVQQIYYRMEHMIGQNSRGNFKQAPIGWLVTGPTSMNRVGSNLDDAKILTQRKGAEHSLTNSQNKLRLKTHAGGRSCVEQSPPHIQIHEWYIVMLYN